MPHPLDGPAPPAAAGLLPWERKRRAAGVPRQKIQRKPSSGRGRGEERRLGPRAVRRGGPGPSSLLTPQSLQGQNASAHGAARNPQPQRQVHTCGRRPARSGGPAPCILAPSPPAPAPKVPEPGPSTAHTCHRLLAALPVRRDTSAPTPQAHADPAHTPQRDTDPMLCGPQRPPQAPHTHASPAPRSPPGATRPHLCPLLPPPPGYALPSRVRTLQPVRPRPPARPLSDPAGYLARACGGILSLQGTPTWPGARCDAAALGTPDPAAGHVWSRRRFRCECLPAPEPAPARARVMQTCANPPSPDALQPGIATSRALRPLGEGRGSPPRRAPPPTGVSAPPPPPPAPRRHQPLALPPSLERAFCFSEPQSHHM